LPYEGAESPDHFVDPVIAPHEDPGAQEAREQESIDPRPPARVPVVEEPKRQEEPCGYRYSRRTNNRYKMGLRGSDNVMSFQIRVTSHHAPLYA